MDKLEEIAVTLHDGWRDFQVQLGRTLGAARTAHTHPHMCPWSELDEESRNQDRFVAAALLLQWLDGRLVPHDLPRAIHDAWARWEHVHGRKHHHALPFEIAHQDGADDHELQAQAVLPLLHAIARLPA